LDKVSDYKDCDPDIAVGLLCVGVCVCRFRPDNLHAFTAPVITQFSSCEASEALAVLAFSSRVTGVVNNAITEVVSSPPC